MQEMQQQIYNVLQQNIGNRLTAELITGLTARLQAISAAHSEKANKAQQGEKTDG